jgi:hypothetical protein
VPAIPKLVRRDILIEIGRERIAPHPHHCRMYISDDVAMLIEFFGTSGIVIGIV